MTDKPKTSKQDIIDTALFAGMRMGLEEVEQPEQLLRLFHAHARCVTASGQAFGIVDEVAAPDALLAAACLDLSGSDPDDPIVEATISIRLAADNPTNEAQS